MERSQHLSGVVLVARQGQPIFQGAYGWASREYSRKNTMATKFNLASMNKMFTGLSIMQLYQAGKLSPEDKVGKYLPGLSNKAIRDSVTIHQLLTHTSGVGNFWEEHAGAAKEKYRTAADYLPLFINKPLAFTPGAGFLYSNGGYILLGLIIEAVSHQSYDDYVNEHIYIPAGMKHTGAYALDEINIGLATGYIMDPERPGHWKNNTWQNVIKGTPAGGGYSTARDLLQFSNALLQYKLLNKQYTATYLQGRVKYGKGFYGYGFSSDTINAHHVLGHTGGHFGIANELMIYEDLDYTVIILTNGEVEDYWEISNTIKDMLTGPSAATAGYFYTTRIVSIIHEKGLSAALDEFRMKPANIQLRESVLERLGAVALFNKQFSDAVNIFLFSITCFPQSASGYYNLAESFRLKGDTAQAIRQYDKYLAIEPDDPQVKQKLELLRR
ncbi:CubicO group peptidase, beta-lactamase class C family [Chitinophaga rupis]|uniref:CubicO group peptidase, beta-lactamase class C family n=1 Tax=Chitinophaga rupis TaxID=573321 RepID=A0A1H7US44_9BACT|nr:serine hydrolase [Chitinophaga rupis]SEL99802.1 CubicO group peptidase, beta-lactamase class C family [Chitinophaga rupis]